MRELGAKPTAIAIALVDHYLLVATSISTLTTSSFCLPPGFFGGPEGNVDRFTAVPTFLSFGGNYGGAEGAFLGLVSRRDFVRRFGWMVRYRRWRLDGDWHRRIEWLWNEKVSTVRASAFLTNCGLGYTNGGIAVWASGC